MFSYISDIRLAHSDESCLVAVLLTAVGVLFRSLHSVDYSEVLINIRSF